MLHAREQRRAAACKLSLFDHVSRLNCGPGKALLRITQDLNADMLVLGAYSRSQMRRLIFGGVTAEVLNRSPIPALMTH